MVLYLYTTVFMSCICAILFSNKKIFHLSQNDQQSLKQLNLKKIFLVLALFLTYGRYLTNINCIKLKWVFLKKTLIRLWKCNHLNYLNYAKVHYLMNELHFFSEMFLPFCSIFVRKITNLKSCKTHSTTRAHCVVPTRINTACENVWEPTCPLTITVCNQSIVRQSPFCFWFTVHLLIHRDNLKIIWSES